jgi:hypothetical protein
MNIVTIRHAALARHGTAYLPSPWRLAAVLCRPGREAAARTDLGVDRAISDLSTLDMPIDLAVERAGHGAPARQGIELIADPTVSENIHELEFSGVFGTASFRIAGRGMPDNPRSSALTAMSALDAIAYWR